MLILPEKGRHPMNNQAFWISLGGAGPSLSSRPCLILLACHKSRNHGHDPGVKISNIIETFSIKKREEAGRAPA